VKGIDFSLPEPQNCVDYIVNVALSGDEKERRIATQVFSDRPLPGAR
jgi:hypothetical protein